MRLAPLSLLALTLSPFAAASTDDDEPACDPGTVELSRNYETRTLTCRVIAGLRPEELPQVGDAALARLSPDDRLALEVRRLELEPPGDPIKPGKSVVPAAAVRRDIHRLIAMLKRQTRTGGVELPLRAVADALRLEDYGVDPAFVAKLKARGAILFQDGIGRNEGEPARTTMPLLVGGSMTVMMDRVISGRLEPSGAGYAVTGISGLHGSFLGFVAARVTTITFLPDRVLIRSRLAGLLPATITLDLTKEAQ